eukprot:comp6671_c1_seq1/m.2452 comp6671_c1_seq1/g.2452  ORF comp6671_c1_seq1/g.2452 comp6671_c1_seq1/m.2452 type:complete len:210 (-) comp6671_c1_seq1:202-831(-)
MSINKSAIDSYKKREEAFWRNLGKQETSELVSNGLDPTSLLFYGELTMAAIGLRSCVLFSFLGPKVTHMYMSQVVGRGDPWVDLGLKFGGIDKELGSPDMHLLGTGYAVATKHSLSGEVMEWLTGKRGRKISDDTLALFLDYPVPLPPLGSGEVIEVAYVDMQSNGDAVVVMTYCALKSQLDTVNSHFKRYRQALDGLMDLRIAFNTIG